MIYFHKVLFIISFVQFVINSIHSSKEKNDGSVCLNNCNKNGDCIDFSCKCYIGYHGDDCSTSFLPKGQKLIPILSIGHYNLTTKNFTNAIINNPYILIGFSAYSCHKCVFVEFEYEKMMKSLDEFNIPFARVNSDVMKSIALEHQASELPALVLFHKV